jgi:diacylglycerol kinase family enzyme
VTGSRFHRASAERQHVIVSLNPKAGARDGERVVRELVGELRGRGMETFLTTDIDEVTELAGDLHAQGLLRAVVAAGGDGTVNLVANRIPSGAPVAVFPLGTENLLARYLTLKTDPRLVAEMIADGWTGRLDAGEANGRTFLLMAGCGFDAEVVRRLDAARTGHIHHLSYAKPILDSIRSYRYPALRVYCRTGEMGAGEWGEPIAARWAFVVNIPRYAGGLNLAPGATPTDGLLHVATFRDGSIWSAVRYLYGVALQQHANWDDVEMSAVTGVRIEAADEGEEAPYQLDGDPGGELPLEVRVLSEQLTLLVPSKWADREGIVLPTDGAN